MLLIAVRRSMSTTLPTSCVKLPTSLARTELIARHSMTMVVESPTGSGYSIRSRPIFHFLSYIAYNS